MGMEGLAVRGEASRSPRHWWVGVTVPLLH